MFHFEKWKIARVIFCMLTVCIILFITAAGAIGSDTSVNVNPEDAIDAFAAVLNHEAAFFSADGGEYYDPVQGREMLLKDYVNSFDISFEISTFVVIDLDQDGVSEVILEMQPIGFFEVLRYEEGTVIGYIFPYRAMMNLKQDGSFEYSNGADDSGHAKLVFTSDGYEFVHMEESGAEVASWFEFAPDNIAFCLE